MSNFINDCADFIRDAGFNTFRFSTALPGEEIQTAELIKTNRCQDIYSGAKAFTLTAIGILADRGVLSLGEKITDIFSGQMPDGFDPRWESATVEHAILHKAGFKPSFMDIDVESTMAFGTDHLKTLFETPLEYAPGEGRIYTDAAYYLLSRIVSVKTSMKLDDFLWQELFSKLNFAEAAWSRCPMGYPIGATGLYVHSSDMVKLAILYRDGGVYGGERILSESWVNTVKSKEYCFEWDKTHTVFFKGGMNGQKNLFNEKTGRAFAMQSCGADSDAVAAFIASYKE